ncbi:MAG: DUF2961 domain-containing protein [Pirellulales bacterium]|nr:DUF2961 domain-containing protein [Pirellulales bacterium]
MNFQEILRFCLPGLLLFGVCNSGVAGEDISAPGQPATSLDRLWQPPLAVDSRRASSYDRNGFNEDLWPIEPGRRRTLLDVQGSSGKVRRIWFTLSSGKKSIPETYLQTTRLRFAFDGQTTVDDVPVGMFLATGPWRVNDLVSPVDNVMRARPGNRDRPGVGRGSFNVHWPMPFARSVKIEIANQGSVPLAIHFHANYELESVGDNPLLFHATYHRSHFTEPHGKGGPEQGKHFNYTLADIQNRQGRYVGTVLAVESHPDRPGKWYEGDEMFYVDGERTPSIHGTGTEDYFGMAWGVHRPYQAHDHGVTHYQRNLTDHDRFYDGRFVLYRWHLSDPVIFRKSLHASIEAGHLNDCRQHYESVALWYGKSSKETPQDPGSLKGGKMGR